MHESGGIEGENGFVYRGPKRSVSLEESPDLTDVPGRDGPSKPCFGRLLAAAGSLDVVPELEPTPKAVLAGENELGVCEGDSHLIGQLLADARLSLDFARAKAAQQFLRELLLLVEIGVWGEGTAETLGHAGLLRDRPVSARSARKRSE
jgi:hypothetical protein